MSSARALLEDPQAFGLLSPAQLERLASGARFEVYQEGRRIFAQGDTATACYVLAEGEVALSYRAPAHSGDDHDDPVTETALRRFDDAGRLLGWSTMVAPRRYRATLTALVPSRLLVLDSHVLEALIEEDPPFGVTLMRRILGTLGNRLRETRIRLVTQRYDQEVVAIEALLDQSAETLHVDSPLHKVPYYLRNRLTIADAFQALEVVKAHGEDFERDLAALCLDILDQVRRELRLYQDLQHVYETVASASAVTPAEEIRKRCCEEFIELFEKLDYVIEGRENLPDEPGQIFIMNHLFNHPDNTLPNHFQLTLDTHFVSSMLLLRKYGAAPIRVIRKSGSDEFGHQKYYDRLGYIYVQSGHVDETAGDSDAIRKQRRLQFLDNAGDCLLAGRNIVICPEGTSVATESSPVAFKPGAFRLAAHVNPEPWIVPIAVANFDKNITRTRVAAIVCEPFKLSDAVTFPIDDRKLFDFIEAFRRGFAEQVRTAVTLAQKG